MYVVFYMTHQKKNKQIIINNEKGEYKRHYNYILFFWLPLACYFSFTLEEKTSKRFRGGVFIIFMKKNFDVFFWIMTVGGYTGLHFCVIFFKFDSLLFRSSFLSCKMRKKSTHDSLKTIYVIFSGAQNTSSLALTPVGTDCY